MASVGYNLEHMQIAPVGETPTYTDIKYSVTLDHTIDQNSEKLSADASKPVTAYDAPEGSGSIEFAYMDPTTLAIMTGGTESSSGTAGTVIDRLEIKGNTNPPAVIIVGWIPNVDGTADSAGVRLILPNAKMSVPSGSFQQASFANRTADLTFDPNANNDMLIYEFPVTAPTYTGGVIPANITAPGD